MIACGSSFIWQPSFVKNYSAFCSRHFVRIFFNRFISCIKLSLNHRDQTEVSSLKDFSTNPYTFTYFCHHTAIHSISNRFICFYFGFFFHGKDFFTFCKVFSAFHIARGIIKLIAWTTSFLEERLDFEIT